MTPAPTPSLALSDSAPSARRSPFWHAWRERQTRQWERAHSVGKVLSRGSPLGKNRAERRRLRIHESAFTEVRKHLLRAPDYRFRLIDIPKDEDVSTWRFKLAKARNAAKRARRAARAK